MVPVVGVFTGSFQEEQGSHLRLHVLPWLVVGALEQYLFPTCYSARVVGSAEAAVALGECGVG